MTDTFRWLPGTFTKPLTEDFISDGPKLRKFAGLFCRTEDGRPLVLDDWQAWLIDHVLERYPDDWPVVELRGRLRYRQVVISMGRQNGKSELAQVFGFYGLMMHEAGPHMISLASNADQATIIYNRVKFTIDNAPELKKRFKTTGTRGITRLDKPGVYKVKPAKADALDGIPVTMCLFDEVHLCKEDMWAAMVMGTTAKDDGTVIGITTAGDDTSVLLKDLYHQGRDAVAGQGSERFGFFLWEAPEGCKVDDPEALMDANPAVACGRISMDLVLDQVRSMPEEHARQKRLNQFTNSRSTWMPIHMWLAGVSEPLAPQSGVVFAVDRSSGWEHATITANIKTPTGVHTHVVADIRKPNVGWLVDICERLNKHNPETFVMDGKTLGDLADKLKARGIPVSVLQWSDVTNACTTAYSLIAQGQVTHNGDPLLRLQMPFATKKNVGDTWRISRADSNSYIDAVMATVFGIYWTATQEAAPVQVF